VDIHGFVKSEAYLLLACDPNLPSRQQPKRTGISALYFRTIPEKVGFGLSYEDANYCGGMQQFL
jgi:hypothetical protein